MNFTSAYSPAGSLPSLKLKALKAELRRRMHYDDSGAGMWLAQVIRGYLAYQAVPTNYPSLAAFRYDLTVPWHHTPRRRSQKDRPRESVSRGVRNVRIQLRALLAEVFASAIPASIRKRALHATCRKHMILMVGGTGIEPVAPAV